MVPEVIAQLSEIGALGQAAIPAAFTDPDEAWSLLHRGVVPWEELANTLSEEGLRLVVRGLVCYDRARGPGATGGSVSPVIRLCAVYAQRFPDQEPKLTQWVVANRVNEYEPFGSIICNHASSFSEYLALRLARRASGIRGAEREQERQDDAKATRRHTATTRLAGAVKRGDVSAIEALLLQGADPGKALPKGGSLVDLALDNGRVAVAEFLKSRGIG